MNKKNKLIVLISGIIGILVLVIGISYSVFNFNKSGTNKQLILGDIWMKYTESDTSIQIANATPQKLLASDFVSRGNLNPIMKEQSLIETNELTKCVIYLNGIWGEEDEDWTIDYGESYEDFCRGTGTNWGNTFQEILDNGWWDDEQLRFFEKNNIIISNEDNYVLNVEMATQSLDNVLNELTICNIVFNSYELTGESSEFFCKGEGIIQGLTYKQHAIEDTNIYLSSYNYFLENNVIENNNILLDVNLPYFEFTISGKNTYEKEDIKYEIVLNNSEYNVLDKDTRTERILDKFLKFSLVEIVDNETFLRFHNRSYEDLTNKTVFTENISNEDDDFNRTYRLYMWIGDEVIIGGGDSTYDYDMATWNEKIYASVRVDVNGDFVDKNISNEYIPATDIASFKRLVNNEFQDTIIVDTDGTVYLSGSNEDVNYNYVWYSGKLWRITAINPDGTLKLVTDNIISVISYNELGNVRFYENEENKSYAYQWLNEDFLDTLVNSENIIVTNAKWNATPSDDVSKKLEKMTMHEASVGLLNSYEYYMSFKNTKYKQLIFGYLYMDNEWWLLNSDTESNIWYSTNFIDVVSGGTEDGKGIRPSINLKIDIEFSSGDGSKENPYIIKDATNQLIENKTQLNERISGEYVNFDGELYRIIGIENNESIKLNKVDYVRDANNEIMTKYLSSSMNYGKNTNIQSNDYWDYYLNNTWYNNISYNYKNMLVRGTYYINRMNTGNYKKSICKFASNQITIKNCEKTTNIWSGYVGLQRLGEMFASQLEKNGNFTMEIWTITQSTDIFIETISWYGHNVVGKPGSDLNAARPTITLSSEVYITSGDGTEQNPFEIAMRIPEDN